MDDVDMAATTQGLSKPKVAFLGPYASYTHQVCSITPILAETLHI